MDLTTLAAIVRVPAWAIVFGAAAVVLLVIVIASRSKPKS